MATSKSGMIQSPYTEAVVTTVKPTPTKGSAAPPTT
jgi:hypothetical protein